MAEDKPMLTVFYDGGCPICSREVAFYRGRLGADALCWVDVSRETPHGLDQQTILARIHARLPDGKMVSGAVAFGQIWQRVPGFGWLGRLVSWRPVTPFAEAAYRGFLVVRRLWR